jgi:D-alanyl-D-alanine carboxypeptidase
VKAAQLLERGFANNTLSWLRPSLGTVDSLVPIDASPPNLRDEMCGGKRKRPASDEDEGTVASNAAAGGPTSGETAITFFTAGLQPPMVKPSELLAGAAEASEPVPVYTGPTKTGAALIAAVAGDAEKQATRPRGKKSRVAAKKPDTSDEETGKAKKDAKSDTKPAAKPAAVRHANAKPAGAAPKAGEKPVATGDKPAAKPAKPKAAAIKPKNTTEAKPAGQKTTAAAPRS